MFAPSSTGETVATAVAVFTVTNARAGTGLGVGVGDGVGVGLCEALGVGVGVGLCDPLGAADGVGDGVAIPMELLYVAGGAGLEPPPPPHAVINATAAPPNTHTQRDRPNGITITFSAETRGHPHPDLRRIPSPTLSVTAGAFQRAINGCDGE
jgi:hypothetical protein